MAYKERNKYDVAFKNEMVRRYFELKTSSSMNIPEYCKINNLSESTFNRWLMIYRRSLDETQRSAAGTVSLSPSSGFIPLSRSDMERVDFNRTIERSSSSKMTLNINGAEIAFSKDQLKDVIEVLKRC